MRKCLAFAAMLAIGAIPICAARPGSPRPMRLWPDMVGAGSVRARRQVAVL